MLLFDPTRGIDVGTKHQVYDLVRSLADEGAAIIMFTSELREVAMVCDRAAVLHNGRIVAELPADAGENALLSAAHGLEAAVVITVTTMPVPSTTVVAVREAAGVDARRRRAARRLLLWRASQLPDFGGFEIRTITAGTMPLAFLAMAQGVIVISGGVDLSVGAMMVLANCLSALWMEDQGLGACLAFAVLALAVTVALSTLTGVIITASGVPDIIVTLAASFFLAGLALFIVGGPGGGTSPDFQRIVAGSLSNPWPSVLWIVGALLVVWLPLKRSRLGLAIYAVGSNRTAAFLSGVRIARTQGARLLDRRAVRRLRRSRRHGVHRRRRATGDDRRQRHAEQRRRRRARWRRPDRRRRRARRAGARRGVPDADPGDHARPRLGPEQRRDRPRA